MDRFLKRKEPPASSDEPLKLAKPTLAPEQQAAVDALTAGLRCDEWRKLLSSDFSKPYLATLATSVEKERKKAQVFPPAADVWNAFNLTSFGSLRVVILGQDPYHNVGQAHGLCFSVRPGTMVPPSLKNIYKELATDVPGFRPPSHGNLEAWAKQGVLLLNATMTVEAHKANSHAKLGWQTFTDNVVQLINVRAENIVFILWGQFAQKKGARISRTRHHVIEAAHPSPLSVTKFMGCKVFSKANAYLEKKGKKPIDWQL
jgi:uracil-DNA glycosylase